MIFSFAAVRLVMSTLYQDGQNSTILEGQMLGTVHIMEGTCSRLGFFVRNIDFFKYTYTYTYTYTYKYKYMYIYMCVYVCVFVFLLCGAVGVGVGCGVV